MVSNIFLFNDFINSLSDENKDNIKNATIGTEIIVETSNNAIINGTINGFEGSDLLMNIGNKSSFAITSDSVKKIIMKNKKILKD